jgi:hypothetical protein
MIGLWHPWRRLLPIWLPTVLLCLVSIGTHIWLSSDTLGRSAQIRDRVAELEQTIAELERIRSRTTEEIEGVAALEDELDHLHTEVFGSLDIRLTSILRAVGDAARTAGLFPGQYGYSYTEDELLDLTRFTVLFSVQGTYEQIRILLEGLQSSSEFLFVDEINFTGEESTVTRDLKIKLDVATYLAEADFDRLRLLAERPTVGGEAD